MPDEPETIEAPLTSEQRSTLVAKITQLQEAAKVLKPRKDFQEVVQGMEKQIDSLRHTLHRAKPIHARLKALEDAIQRKAASIEVIDREAAEAREILETAILKKKAVLDDIESLEKELEGVRGMAEQHAEEVPTPLQLLMQALEASGTGTSLPPTWLQRTSAVLTTEDDAPRQPVTSPSIASLFSSQWQASRSAPLSDTESAQKRPKIETDIKPDSTDAHNRLPLTPTQDDMLQLLKAATAQVAATESAQVRGPLVQAVLNATAMPAPPVRRCETKENPPPPATATETEVDALPATQPTQLDVEKASKWLAWVETCFDGDGHETGALCRVCSKRFCSQAVARDHIAHRAKRCNLAAVAGTVEPLSTAELSRQLMRHKFALSLKR